MNARVCAVSFHHVESKHHEIHASNVKPLLPIKLSTLSRKLFPDCKTSFLELNSCIMRALARIWKERTKKR